MTTSLHIFTNATLAAIRLALNPNESPKVHQQAEYAAYANARAAWRAAVITDPALALPPYALRETLRTQTLAVGRAS